MVVKLASLKLIQNLFKYVFAICSENFISCNTDAKIQEENFKKKSMLGWHFKKYTNMVELHPKMQDRQSYNEPTD